MSPKLVDVARALETLRRESPTPAQTERLLKTIHRSPRRSLARPLALIMTTAALALILVLPPRTLAGAAWAQTVANTAASPNVHVVSRWPDGKVASEEWRSGVKRATVLYGKSGRPMIETRSDGKTRMNYAGWFDYAASRGEKPGPNAHEWASVYPDTQPGPAFYELPLGEARITLSAPDVKVVGHKEAADGRPETYRLEHTIRLGGKALLRPQRVTAEIDPATGRIRALVETDGKGARRTEIEYPASIPASVFAPRPQAVKGVDVYTPAVFDRIQRGVRRGLGKQGPVTLRAVIVDGSGDLWVFWTGALPEPRLPHPFSAPGVRLGRAFTNKIYTTAWRESPKMNGVPVATKGPRIGGMGRTTLSKLGATVDLDIPYLGGMARFRKVRYERVGYVQHLSSILGAKRDYR